MAATDRKYYVYESDGGLSYKLLLSVDNSTAAGTGLVLFGAQPGVQSPPKRFKPRGIYWQDANGKRKFLVCGTSTAALYVKPGSSPVTIATIAGNTTGRRGEKLTF